ncbi:hypothetical protein EDD21DRAFT_424268 [Dissophora ornata]|nr:hypothetical protein EDD21DRAFT_424268 [Dissophora ornata]
MLAKSPAAALGSSPVNSQIHASRTHPSLCHRPMETSQQSSSNEQNRIPFEEIKEHSQQEPGFDLTVPSIAAIASYSVDLPESEKVEWPPFGTNTDAIQDTSPLSLMDNTQKPDVEVASHHKYEHEKRQQQRKQSAPVNPLSHLLTPGTYFSPSCSRIGLASTPSAAPFTATDHRHQQHYAQSQVGADSDPQLPQQWQQREELPVRPRQRIFSNTGSSSGNYSRLHLQNRVPSFSKSSLFRPILDLLAATTSGSPLQSSQCDGRSSNGNQLSLASSNDDLPSPIYNPNSSDNSEEEEGNDARVNHRAVSATITSTTSSEAIFTPTLATDAIEDRDTNSLLALADGKTTNDTLCDELLLVMSATLDARYWAPSASVESFEVAEELRVVVAATVEAPTEPSVEIQACDMHLVSTIPPGQMRRQQSSMICAKDLVRTELREMELQAEQEIAAMSKPDSFEEDNNTDDMDIIYIDYDHLIRMCTEEDQEHERERQLWRQLWCRGRMEPDLTLNILHESETYEFDMAQNSFIVEIGERPLEPEEQAEATSLKRVRFDSNLQIIACLQDERCGHVAALLQSNDEQSISSIDSASPGWKPLLVFEPEFITCSEEDDKDNVGTQYGSDDITLRSMQKFTSSVSFPPSPEMGQTATFESVAPILFALAHPLPPLPESVFVPTPLLPPLPSPPKCGSSSSSVFPVLETLSPLLRSPIETPSTIISAYLAPATSTSPGPLSSLDCTSPRPLELATARVQLSYWKQTVTRLRDQEKVLTNRINFLVQELVDVLERNRNAELRLEAKENVVQELRQELLKEQEFGFASVQEAALSIQEKQVLERALEDSWKELGMLRTSTSVPRQVLCSASLSDMAAKPQLSSTCCKSSSASFQSLVKYLCLMLLSVLVLTATILMLYGHQHELRQVYHALARVVDQASRHLDVKVGIDNLHKLAQKTLLRDFELTSTLKRRFESNSGDLLMVLAERAQQARQIQIQRISSAVQLIVDMWMELDLESVLEGYWLAWTWSWWKVISGLSRPRA